MAAPFVPDYFDCQSIGTCVDTQSFAPPILAPLAVDILATVAVGGGSIAALDLLSGDTTTDFPQLDPADYGIFPYVDPGLTIAPPDINFDNPLPYMPLPGTYIPPAIDVGTLEPPNINFDIPVDMPDIVIQPVPIGPMGPQPLPPDVHVIPQTPTFTPIDPDLVPTGVPVPALPPLPQLEPPIVPRYTGPQTDPRVGTRPFVPDMPFPSIGLPNPIVSPVPLAPPYVAPTPQTTPTTTPSPTTTPGRVTTPHTPTTPDTGTPSRLAPSEVPLTLSNSQTVPFRTRKPKPSTAPQTAPSAQTADENQQEQCECSSKDKDKKRGCGEGYFRTSASGKTEYRYWTKRKCSDRPSGYEPHHGKRKYKWRSSKAHSQSRQPVPPTTY